MFWKQKQEHYYFHINIYLKTLVSYVELNLETRTGGESTFNYKLFGTVSSMDVLVTREHMFFCLFVFPDKKI